MNCTSISALSCSSINNHLLLYHSLIHHSSQGRNPCLHHWHQCCQHFWPKTSSLKLIKGRVIWPARRSSYYRKYYSVDWDSGLPKSLPGSASYVLCKYFQRLHYFCVEFWRAKICALDGLTFIRTEGLISLAWMVSAEHSAANSFALTGQGTARLALAQAHLHGQWAPCLLVLKLKEDGEPRHGAGQAKSSLTIWALHQSPKKPL